MDDYRAVIKTVVLFENLETMRQNLMFECLNDAVQESESLLSGGYVKSGTGL